MYTHFYKHNTVIILIYYQETNNISLHDCSGLRLTSRSSWWCPQRRSSARPVSWCRLTISCPHWSHCRPSIRKTQRVSDYRGEGIDNSEEWVLFLNISVQEDWQKTTIGRGTFKFHQLHWDRIQYQRALVFFNNGKPRKVKNNEVKSITPTWSSMYRGM